MIRTVFFGSSRFSVLVLDELERRGLIPVAVVTTPDKPQGRSMKLMPTPVKLWAVERGIKVYDPASLDASFAETLSRESSDVFIVASYGRIIPGRIIDIPRRKTLNIHPSLLPKYRGASPLQSAMLDDDTTTGVTVMCVDEQVDHGPIVAQKKVTISEWPPYDEFETRMAHEGAALLAEILPAWVDGTATEHEQDHAVATYTRKLTKEDGLIDLSGDPYENFRKIRALSEWPVAYFMIEHRGRKMKVKVTAATYKNGTLQIERVIPEGGNEMPYEAFVRGYGGTSARA